MKLFIGALSSINSQLKPGLFVLTNVCLSTQIFKEVIQTQVKFCVVFNSDVETNASQFRQHIKDAVGIIFIRVRVITQIHKKTVTGLNMRSA